MTSVQDRATEQVSVALEYVQGKRRVERVLEAATALVERYGAAPEPAVRLAMAVELIRRNLSPEVSLSFAGRSFGIGAEGASGNGTEAPAPADDAVYELRVTRLADGAGGLFRARFTEQNPLLLTQAEWRSALRLLVGIAVTAAGGYVG
jgi:hypothetical protein